MSVKNSNANKRRWASVPPEKRSKIASKNAKTRWSGVDARGRRLHALKMVRARGKIE